MSADIELAARHAWEALDRCYIESDSYRSFVEGFAAARATPSPAPIQRDTWISVEDQLPAVGQVVAVYSPPTIHDWPGSINLQFDCIDENDDDASSWAGHNNHYEHWCCVAKSEGDTGPSEKAPYTHWLPIPAAPTVKASQ